MNSPPVSVVALSSALVADLALNAVALFTHTMWAAWVTAGVGFVLAAFFGWHGEAWRASRDLRRHGEHRVGR